MASPRGTVVIVDDRSDRLAALVAQRLVDRGVTCQHIEADRLGLVDLSIDGDRAVFGGASVSAVLFRAGPWTAFADGFHRDDASFASAEVAAAWLAVLNLPTVTTPNRFDAEVWSTRSEWAVWRRRLRRRGIEFVGLAVGDVDDDGFRHWLPWGGGVARLPGETIRRAFGPALTDADTLETTTWVFGRQVSGPPAGASAAAAARELAGDGIALASITESGGRVASCTAHPVLDDAAADTAADLIAEEFGEALSRRR